VTAQPKILVTRRQFPEAIGRLEAAARVTVLDGYNPPAPDELKRLIAGCSALFAHITDDVNAEVMDAAGASLRVIGEYGVGYDNVDVDAASERDIAVGNTPGVLSETVAEFAIALIQASARRVAEADRFVRAGKWEWFDPMGLMGTDITGATLGIVGFGRIGREVAKRALGLGMKVVYYDPVDPADDADCERVAALHELLERADFVTVHTPLTPETRGLIGAAELKRMKSTAVLVNTSRGPVVDLDSVSEALRDGEIAHAALDVTEPEPPPPGHPLLSLENVTLTPHIASSSVNTRRIMAMMTVDNILAALNGSVPPNCVNADRLTWA
jgi:phosphoglycerate dehydrogenase-like enzyme